VLARSGKELVTRWGDVSELSGGGSIEVMPCFGEGEDIRVVRMDGIGNEGFAVLMEEGADVEGVDTGWGLGRARVKLDVAGKENENECEWGARGERTRVSMEKGEGARDAIKEAELGTCSGVEGGRET